jgi:hypothetical protein
MAAPLSYGFYEARVGSKGVLTFALFPFVILIDFFGPTLGIEPAYPSGLMPALRLRKHLVTFCGNCLDEI